MLRYRRDHLSYNHDKQYIIDRRNHDVWRDDVDYGDRDRQTNRYHKSASVIPRKTSQADPSAHGAFRRAYFARQPSQVVGMAVVGGPMSVSGGAFVAIGLLRPSTVA